MNEDEKKKEIEDVLTSCQLALAGPIAANYEDPNSFIAFIVSSEDDNGVRRPSRAQTRAAQAFLSLKNYKLSFVYVNGNSFDLDSTLKKFLLDELSNFVRNSFTTETNNKINIWVEPKQSLSEDQYYEIEQSLKLFTRNLSSKDLEINFTKKKNTPSATVIISTIRTMSPVQIKDLSDKLEAKGHEVPNEVWLRHSLDKLRKSGFIAWRKGDYYFLTIQGLNALGTEKNRRSPDVVRALELARSPH
jgi:hypothetical protein